MSTLTERKSAVHSPGQKVMQVYFHWPCRTLNALKKCVWNRVSKVENGWRLRAFSRHSETCEIYSQWESHFSISWLWTHVCFQKILLLLSRGALGLWVCEYRGRDTGLWVFLCSPGYTGDGEGRSVWRWDQQLTAMGSERKGGIKNDSYFPSWVYDLHLFRSERVWKWEHTQFIALD